MAVKNDIVKTTVLMDGKQSLNELGKLEMELSELRQVTKALKKDSDKYNEAMKRMRGVRNDIKKRREELGMEGMTLQQLIRYQRELRREITNTTTRGTKDYEKLRQKLVQVTAQVTKQRMEMRGMSGAWVQLGQSVRQSLAMFGPVAVITSLIYGLGAAVRSVARDNITLSDTMADVQKNTELTNDELAVLMDRLESLDTKTSKQQLLELLTIGGKLGIRGVKDLEGFARAADKINVALGEDLGGDPITTLRELGKLTNTFKLKQKFGIEDSLIRVGSVLNDLGRSSEANEERIADFTKRMGPMAAAADISIQNIMGMGAAADLMGLSMEVAGTATSQIIGKMVDKRADYVQFARDTEGNTLSLKAFTELLNNDTNAALLAVLRGLKDNDGALTDFIDSLGDMGLEGQRVRQVIAGLAGGLDKVEEQQQIANRAFAEGTSVLAEFDQKNKTAGANLAKLGKAIKDNFINSGMVRWLERVTAKMVEFIEVPVSEQLQEQQLRLNVLVGAIQNVNDNQEVRNGLLKRLQSEYPDFLENLDAETVSNEQLAARLADVNKQMMQRIIIQQSEEQISEMIREQVRLMNERIDLEERQSELRLNPQKAMGRGSGTQGGYADFLEGEKEEINASMTELDRKIEEVKAKRQELFDAFDLSLGNATSTEDKSTDPNAHGTVNPANTDTGVDGSVPDSEEYVLLDTKQLDIEVEAIKDATRDIISAEEAMTQHNLEMSILRQQHREKEKELMQEIIQLQVESGLQAGLQAESWGDAADIMKQQIRDMIFQQISQVIATQFTKVIAMLPIPPPLNVAVAGALSVAAGQAMRQAIPSLYYGGDVGETGNGMGKHGGDKYGNFSGMYATHGGEFITPAWVRSYPDVQAAIGVTKARMNGTTMTTAPTAGSMNVTSTLDASGMDSVASKMELGVAMFADAVNVLREHGIEAKISKNESGRVYETGQKEYRKKESARNRGNLS